MYPGEHARRRPDQPATIMATSGEVVTYTQLEQRSNKLAHLLQANGLRRLDHYAVFMENNARYAECCAAGERAGLYYTCITSFLTPDEAAYIRQQQRIPNSHCVGSKAPGGSDAFATVPECPAMPDHRRER